MKDLLQQGFTQYLQSLGYSNHTIAAYIKDLSLYYDFCYRNVKQEPILLSTVYKYFSYLSEEQKLEPSSLERKRAAFMTFSNYLKIARQIVFLEKDSIPSPKKKYSIPNHLSENEIQNLILKMKKETPLEYRNYLMILLLYGTGIRLSELLTLSPAYYNSRERSFRVKGKGSKERLIFLPESVAQEYQKYLKLFKDRIDKAGSLFFNERNKALSPRGVQYILAQIGLEQNIPKKIHPHMFRHTFATHMLVHKADIRKVAEFMGHESLNTTQKYTHLNREILKDTVLNYHPHA